jgi:hypothetical protein
MNCPGQPDSSKVDREILIFGSFVLSLKEKNKP